MGEIIRRDRRCDTIESERTGSHALLAGGNESFYPALAVLD
jgi:hypothetical protein